MTTIIRWSELLEKEIHRGHYRRQIEFPSCYLALHRYTADGEGYGLHSHVETQVGYILSGEMAMIFEGAPNQVATGHSYVIPSGMVHGGKAAGRESVIANLYVKGHLVVGKGSPVCQTNWDESRTSVTACGVRQSMLNIPPGERPPAPRQGAEDRFDILLSGGHDGLGLWDGLRSGGPSAPPAGPTGSRMFRIEIISP